MSETTTGILLAVNGVILWCLVACVNIYRMWVKP